MATKVPTTRKATPSNRSAKDYQEYLNQLYWSEGEDALEYFAYLTNERRSNPITKAQLNKAMLQAKLGEVLRKHDSAKFFKGLQAFQNKGMGAISKAKPAKKYIYVVIYADGGMREQHFIDKPSADLFSKKVNGSVIKIKPIAKGGMGAPKAKPATKRKTATISISDFSFKMAGYGHYKVTYTSPVTGQQWTKTTTDMQLIDATKNADSPKVVDLNRLKAITKR